MDLQPYLSEASTALGIFTFFLTAAVKRVRNQPIHLKDLLVKAFAASTIPTGILLLVCAFKPSLLQNLTGFNYFYIAVGGLVMLYLACELLFGKNSTA